MHIYSEKAGNGSPVVLIHGMAASGRYWHRIMSTAPPGKYLFLAIDLPGFGRSSQPHGLSYDYDMFVSAIVEAIRDAGITEKCTVIGHSLGSLLALRLAARHPEMINKVIACNLPFYPDKATVKKEITKSTKVRELAYYGITSKMLCTLWCSWMRPLTRHIAPLYLRSLPAEVAQDSLLHTWEAYSKSLQNILTAQDVMGDIQASTIRTIFIYGAQDGSLKYFEEANLLKLRQGNQLIVVHGSGHHTPLDAPDIVLSTLDS